MAYFGLQIFETLEFNIRAFIATFKGMTLVKENIFCQQRRLRTALILAEVKVFLNLLIRVALAINVIIKYFSNTKSGKQNGPTDTVIRTCETKVWHFIQNIWFLLRWWLNKRNKCFSYCSIKIRLLHKKLFLSFCMKFVVCLNLWVIWPP